MAEITFHANINQGNTNDASDPTIIDHGAGTGIGFFGDGFNLSVPVGSWQNTTWVTNSDGTDSNGTKLQNTKYHSDTEVKHNSEDLAYKLFNIPNYWAPLNIRFTHEEAVATQNCKLRIFNRNDIDVAATEVTTEVYEVRHPHPTAGTQSSIGDQTADSFALNHRASNIANSVGDHEWFTFDGVGAQVDMNLTSSPGISGLNGDDVDSTLDTDGVGVNSKLNWLTDDGFTHKSTRHDWYLALSASPQAIGSKTEYGLYFTLEYL